MTKKYKLAGVDGNAFAVMGYTEQAMRDSGFSEQEIDEYLKDATSGDYKHLLAVSSVMINKCNERGQ